MLTEEEIALTSNKPDEWTMSQEREFMENLLCQRVNFFLVVFSLFLASAAASEKQDLAGIVLAVGFVVCLMVGLTVYRAHVKHHWIMHNKIFRLKGHPAKVVNDAAKRRGCVSLFSVSRVLGIVIPATCCVVLLVGSVLVFLGIVKMGGR